MLKLALDLRVSFSNRNRVPGGDQNLKVGSSLQTGQRKGRWIKGPEKQQETETHPVKHVSEWLTLSVRLILSNRRGKRTILGITNMTKSLKRRVKALLKFGFYGSLEHLFRPIIICSKVTVSELTHPGNNTVLLVQSCVDLGCHNLQKWEALADFVNTLRRLDVRSPALSSRISNAKWSTIEVETDVVESALTMITLTEIRFKNMMWDSGTPFRINNSIAWTAEFPAIIQGHISLSLHGNRPLLNLQGWIGLSSMYKSRNFVMRSSNIRK